MPDLYRLGLRCLHGAREAQVHAQQQQPVCRDDARVARLGGLGVSCLERAACQGETSSRHACFLLACFHLEGHAFVGGKPSRRRARGLLERAVRPDRPLHLLRRGSPRADDSTEATARRPHDAAPALSEPGRHRKRLRERRGPRRMQVFAHYLLVRMAPVWGTPSRLVARAIYIVTMRLQVQSMSTMVASRVPSSCLADGSSPTGSQTTPPCLVALICMYLLLSWASVRPAIAPSGPSYHVPPHSPHTTSHSAPHHSTTLHAPFFTPLPLVGRPPPAGK